MAPINKSNKEIYGEQNKKAEAAAIARKFEAYRARVCHIFNGMILKA